MNTVHLKIPSCFPHLEILLEPSRAELSPVLQALHLRQLASERSHLSLTAFTNRSRGCRAVTGP